MLFVMVMVVLLSIFLILFLYMTMLLLSVKNLFAKKFISFESGFKSVGKVQTAFSIHFFLMMLMFVLFDLEIIMVVGVIVMNEVMNLVFLWVFMFVVFSFFMEWFYGKLVWVI